MPELLPFTSEPAQNVIVQLGDTKYEFDVLYNERSEQWVMSVKNFATQAVIIQSVPLVVSQPLLDPYNFHLGNIMAFDETEQGKEAGPDDLGGRVKVYWFSEDEVASA